MSGLPTVGIEIITEKPITKSILQKGKISLHKTAKNYCYAIPNDIVAQSW